MCKGCEGVKVKIFPAHAIALANTCTCNVNEFLVQNAPWSFSGKLIILIPLPPNNILTEAQLSGLLDLSPLDLRPLASHSLYPQTL